MPRRSSKQEDDGFKKTANHQSDMSNLERDQLGHRGAGHGPSSGQLRGLDHLGNPKLNKVSSFYAFPLRA